MMPFPQPPVRQHMLMKTERKAVGADGGAGPNSAATNMNQAFKELARENYDVSQIFPAEGGFLVIGQRISSPVSDPTPGGVPIPGTAGVQAIDVIYTFISEGKEQTKRFGTLAEAVKWAINDLEGKSSPIAQPIKIEITSKTSYGPGDLHVLRNMV